MSRIATGSLVLLSLVLATCLLAWDVDSASAQTYESDPKACCIPAWGSPPTNPPGTTSSCNADNGVCAQAGSPAASCNAELYSIAVKGYCSDQVYVGCKKDAAVARIGIINGQFSCFVRIYRGCGCFWTSNDNRPADHLDVSTCTGEGCPNSE